MRVLIHYRQTNHSPFLDSFRKLLESIHNFGALLQSVIISVSQQHVVRDIKDTLAKFANAVPVDVYNSCAYIDISLATL